MGYFWSFPTSLTGMHKFLDSSIVMVHIHRYFSVAIPVPILKLFWYDHHRQIKLSCQFAHCLLKNVTLQNKAERPLCVYSRMLPYNVYQNFSFRLQSFNAIRSILPFKNICYDSNILIPIFILQQ